MSPNNPPKGALARLVDFLRQFWKLVLVTHRCAMAARFCVIAGLAASAALLTVDQGRELLRAMAEPGVLSSGYNLAQRASYPTLAHLPWTEIGWFFFTTLILSLACWATTKLTYGLVHDPTDDAEEEELQKLMEKKLPVYFGALPLVVAGCAFFQESFTYLEPAARPTGLAVVVWAASLFLLFGVPAVVVVRWLWDHKTDGVGRPGPGLRFILWPCLSLPFLGALYLWWHASKLEFAWAPVPALCLSLAFFLLAFVLYRWEQPWLIALPGFALFIAYLCGVVEKDASTGLLVAALAHVALGLLVQFFFVYRRARFAVEAGTPGAGEPASGPGTLQEPLSFPKGFTLSQAMGAIFLFRAPAGAGQPEVLVLRAVALLALVLLAALAFIWSDPQWLPRIIGPAAVLTLGLTAWVVVGNVLLIRTHVMRLPLITGLLIFALVCSICEDNHEIRLVQPVDPKAAPVKAYDNVAALFKDWRGRMNEHFPLTAAAGGEKPRRPCFIVAAEGGGIRAAFWTARVLTRLQDESRKAGARDRTPDFASHVLAISGVSGGSLGASVFDALYAEEDQAQRANARSVQDPATEANAVGLGQNAAFILGSDHLSPLVGSMLFPDALQRFIPCTVRGTDRGTTLEKSWENRWEYFMGPSSTRFRAPFLELWQAHTDPATPWLPALFLNATRVEDGRRIIASNVHIRSGPHGDFADALDLHDYLWSQSTVIHNPLERLAQILPGAHPAAGAENSPKRDVRLSTATHCSARFTYFSPAARLPSGHRVVDGGYYENSGAQTARDILAAVQATIDGDPSLGDVQPVVILIRFIGSDDLQSTAFKPIAATRTAPVVAAYAYSDLLSPLLSLYNVRDAHATDEYQRFGKDWGRVPDTTPQESVFVFSLAQRHIPLPLGWMLSGRAAGEMLDEMPDSQADPAQLSPAVKVNQAHLNEILQLLHRMQAK